MVLGTLKLPQLKAVRPWGVFGKATLFVNTGIGGVMEQSDRPIPPESTTLLGEFDGGCVRINSGATRWLWATLQFVATMPLLLHVCLNSEPGEFRTIRITVLGGITATVRLVRSQPGFRSEFLRVFAPGRP